MCGTHNRRSRQNAATLCALRPCSATSLRHFARAFLLRSRCVTVPPSPPSGTVLHSTSPTQDALHLSLTLYDGFRCRRSRIPLSSYRRVCWDAHTACIDSGQLNLRKELSPFCCPLIKPDGLGQVLGDPQSFGVHTGKVHLCSRCSLVSSSRQEAKCLFMIDLNIDPFQVAGPQEGLGDHIAPRAFWRRSGMFTWPHAH